MTTHRIALVGHCTPDAFALTSALKGMLGDCEIERINDTKSLTNALESTDLHLVNRVLDGSFGSDSGIALISDLAAQGHRTMLISNYPDAIEESVSAGAAQGFGKSDMRSDTAERALRAALNTQEPES